MPVDPLADVTSHARLGATREIHLGARHLLLNDAARYSALGALVAMMSSRTLVAAGLPAAVNFLHFPIITFAGLLFLFQSRGHRATQLLLSMLGLASAIGVSALINGAGWINAILDLVILIEPFLLLWLIVQVRWTLRDVASFEAILLLLLTIHILVAWYQWLVLGLTADQIKGVFLNQVAGHHVGGAVAFTAAVYFSMHWPLHCRWLRVPFAILAAGLLVFADVKQVLAVAEASLMGLALLQNSDRRRAARYLLLASVAGIILVIAAATIFPALTTWADPTLVKMGLNHKLSALSVISRYHSGVWHAMVGLGPGHTISRLGWMLPDYIHLLQPIGATLSPITQAIRDANDAHWLSASTGSSMWSLLYSWAGLWGDLGVAGLVAYAMLWTWTWRCICRTDLSRFLVLNVLLLAGVYAWLEEPAYVLLLMAFVGLDYQRHANTQRA